MRSLSYEGRAGYSMYYLTYLNRVCICVISSSKKEVINNNDEDHDSVQFFFLLRAELDDQWPLTESERIQITSV
jgi:hypothetical protein